MRRIRLRGMVLAVVAAVCGIMLTGVAHAAPVTQTAPAVQSAAAAGKGDCKSKLSYSGYVHIYLNYACLGTPICSTKTSDYNYSDGFGGCQGYDNDNASSVLNNGQTHAVRVYQDAGWLGGSLCVPLHQYAYDLSTRYFSNGVGANDRISSHYWYTSC